MGIPGLISSSSSAGVCTAQEIWQRNEWLRVLIRDCEIATHRKLIRRQNGTVDLAPSNKMNTTSSSSAGEGTGKGFLCNF